MSKHWILMVLLSTLCAQAGQAAKRPRVPVGKWAVDYAPEYCVLSRDGQPGELGIAIRTRPLSDEHELLFYGLQGRSKEKWFKGQVHKADGTAGPARWALLERSSGRKLTIMETTVTADELAHIFATGSVRFTGDGGIDLRSTMPNVRKAADALRACEEDLAKRWGVQPDEMRAWAKPAKAKQDLRALFWNKDPSRYGYLQSHHVRAVLTIDAAGKPLTCTIIEKSRVGWVNKQICDVLLDEAQFEPARDGQGNPVPGKVVTPRITSARLR